jgi:uncharacterized protein (TIGR03435 family)
MSKTASILVIALSLTAAAQQFEVASIKSSPPPANGRMRAWCQGGPGTDDPALFRCENIPGFLLLTQAFDLKDFQFSGPELLRSARFNVSAKIPEGTTEKQFQRMLQNLLADRLRLKFHSEKKEMQGYGLVVAKNDSKLKPSAGPVDPKEKSAPPVESVKTDANGYAILPPGRASMWMPAPAWHATARYAEETMDQFAAELARETSRPVTNSTGLKGKYDFTVRWIQQPSGPSATNDSGGPDIFKARKNS